MFVVHTKYKDIKDDHISSSSIREEYMDSLLSGSSLPILTKDLTFLGTTVPEESMVYFLSLSLISLCFL